MKNRVERETLFNRTLSCVFLFFLPLLFIFFNRDVIEMFTCHCIYCYRDVIEMFTCYCISCSDDRSTLSLIRARGSPTETRIRFNVGFNIARNRASDRAAGAFKKLIFSGIENTDTLVEKKKRANGITVYFAYVRSRSKGNETCNRVEKKRDISCGL